MAKVTLEELRKLDHINADELRGREAHLLPVWDGERWHLWVPDADGALTEVKIVDVAHSTYLTRDSLADDNDLYLSFLHFTRQHLCYNGINRFISAIEDDFHLLAVSVAKIDHFFKSKEGIERGLLSSFVRSELETIFVVSRSVFDLTQETISRYWNDYIQLLDQVQNAKKKNRKLPSSFRKIILEGERTSTAEEITEKYALPLEASRRYEKWSDFFVRLRGIRDKIVHGPNSAEVIFSTEKGFCVRPSDDVFTGFEWKPEHYYNENIVSLRPWLSHIELLPNCWTVSGII